MNNEAQTWSESLQQLTRKAIRDMDVSPYDGNLHFKNHTTGHAIITAQDLICGKLSLIDKQSGQVSEFANADELLAAGWAVD